MPGTSRLSFEKNTFMTTVSQAELGQTQIIRPPPRFFSLSEVLLHQDPEDLWMIIFNKVYNVTDFASSHPGGVEVLYECGGVDATEAFEDVAHSNDAVNMLAPYYLGDVQPSEQKVYPRLRIPKDMVYSEPKERAQSKKKLKKRRRELERVILGCLVALVFLLGMMCVGLQQIKWRDHMRDDIREGEFIEP